MRFPDLSLRSHVDLGAGLRRPHPVEKAFPDVSPASNTLVTSTGASDKLPVRSFDRLFCLWRLTDPLSGALRTPTEVAVQ